MKRFFIVLLGILAMVSFLGIGKADAQQLLADTVNAIATCASASSGTTCLNPPKCGYKNPSNGDWRYEKIVYAVAPPEKAAQAKAQALSLAKSGCTWECIVWIDDNCPTCESYNQSGWLWFWGYEPKCKEIKEGLRYGLLFPPSCEKALSTDNLPKWKENCLRVEDLSTANCYKEEFQKANPVSYKCSALCTCSFSRECASNDSVSACAEEVEEGMTTEDLAGLGREAISLAADGKVRLHGESADWLAEDQLDIGGEIGILPPRIYDATSIEVNPSPKPSPTPTPSASPK